MGTKLPRAVFSEPTFNEETKTVDPTGFLTSHESDKELYNQISDLLKKDVVPFEKSRFPDNKYMKLADVYSTHAAEVIQHIEGAGKIIFHVLGDSGASVAGKKYQNVDEPLRFATFLVQPRKISLHIFISFEGLQGRIQN